MLILFWIAIAVFAVARQFQAHQVNGRALILLPGILVVAGWGALSHITTEQMALFFAVNLVAAAALGFWRGSTIRVWIDRGQVWQQSTRATASLWLAAVAVRVAFTAIGVMAGLTVAQTTVELPILLGVTLGAQNLVLWLRSAPSLSFAR